MYTIRASQQADFSLEEPTIEIDLPSAIVQYERAPGQGARVDTAPTSIEMSLPLPSGKFYQPLIVSALTILFPVAAAFVGINMCATTGGSKKRH